MGYKSAYKKWESAVSKVVDANNKLEDSYNKLFEELGKEAEKLDMEFSYDWEFMSNDEGGGDYYPLFVVKDNKTEEEISEFSDLDQEWVEKTFSDRPDVVKFLLTIGEVSEGWYA